MTENNPPQFHWQLKQLQDENGTVLNTGLSLSIRKDDKIISVLIKIPNEQITAIEDLYFKMGLFPPYY